MSKYDYFFVDIAMRTFSMLQQHFEDTHHKLMPNYIIHDEKKHGLAIWSLAYLEKNVMADMSPKFLIKSALKT